MPENEEKTAQAEAPEDPEEEAPTEEATIADAEEPEDASATPAPEEGTEPTTQADAESEDTADVAEDSDEPASTEKAEEAEDDEQEDLEAPAEEAEADEEPEDELPEDEEGEPAEHHTTIEELLKAGAHFGHLTSRWHPRMKKYIFMERNNIHIIDLMQTQVLLDKAVDAARRFARRGKTILFAGTKKQAQEIVREHAEECGMPYMVNRWLGGTMTNFQTIRGSIQRMEEIERMERDGTLDKLKKKEKLMRLREHEKLENVLGGIREMAHLPGAIFIVDIKREDIAVNEARKLGIPIIAMVDTNCDPELVEYPVPANDDALSSIELVTSAIAEGIQEGLHERQMKKEAKKKQQS